MTPSTAFWGATAGGAFTPTDISGLRVWLDASDISTLWQDSARTTAVASDADPVGAWDDKSGNDYHILQATSSKRGEYKTSVQNSLDIVRFDGTDDAIRNSSEPPEASQPNTMAAVFKMTSSTAAYHHAIDSGTTVKRQIMGSSNTENWNIYSGAFLANGANNTTTFHLWYGEYNSSSSIFRMDKSEVASGDAGSQAATGLNVGSAFSGTASNFNGDFCEIILYDSALSDGDRDSLETYLEDKWATG